jgi:hypothetical protein
MQQNELSSVRYLLNVLPTIIDKRSLGTAGIVVFLILFGDAVLPIFEHIAFLLLEFTEEGAESLLELAFGLPTREAQIVLVWVGLPIICFLLLRLLRKPINNLKSRWMAFQAWVNSDWSFEEWLRLGGLACVLASLLYLLV